MNLLYLPILTVSNSVPNSPDSWVYSMLAHDARLVYVNSYIHVLFGKIQ